MPAPRVYFSKHVRELTTFSDMWLWQLERRGQFPKRFKLNPEAKFGRVAWVADEVDAWLAARIAVRDQGAAPAAA